MGLHPARYHLYEAFRYIGMKREETELGGYQFERTFEMHRDVRSILRDPSDNFSPRLQVLEKSREVRGEGVGGRGRENCSSWPKAMSHT